MTLMIEKEMHFNKLNKFLYYHNIYLFSATLLYLMLFIFSRKNSLYHFFRFQILLKMLLKNSLNLYLISSVSALKAQDLECFLRISFNFVLTSSH